MKQAARKTGIYPNREDARTTPEQKKSNLVDEACKGIEGMIYSSVLVPGQRLIYQDLAKRLNTSITPVIQALNRLECSKVVRYEQNKGYSIREITEDEARELYEAREALEIFLVPSIVEKLNSAHLNAVKKSFDEYELEAASEFRPMLMFKDAQFHLRIAACAEKKTIYDMLEELYKRIYLQYRPKYISDKKVKEFRAEHMMILDALEKGDADEIIAHSRDHIHRGMQYFLEHLGMLG
jgi:DNA-binding GntR family transcriptional regulator